MVCSSSEPLRYFCFICSKLHTHLSTRSALVIIAIVRDDCRTLEGTFSVHHSTKGANKGVSKARHEAGAAEGKGWAAEAATLGML